MRRFIDYFCGKISDAAYTERETAEAFSNALGNTGAMHRHYVVRNDFLPH
ncbi:hypothetical protein [Cellvibrio sp. PSBB006]|nr:hypothetical protein [Cellvibrio sp. PSBB006]